MNKTKQTETPAEKGEPVPQGATGEIAERIMSGGTGLLFKGSGFYITDYGKDGKKDQRKQAPPEGSKSDTGGSSSEGSPKSSDKPSKGSGSDNPSKGSGSSDA